MILTQHFGMAYPPEHFAFPDKDSKNAVYLRFGDWHHSETSQNNVTGYPEFGVSVYDLDKHGHPSDPDPHMERGHWDEPDKPCEDPWCHDAEHYGNDTRDEMQGRAYRARKTRNANTSDRANLVKGEMVGVGHDGEPLLKNLKEVGHWPCDVKKHVPGADDIQHDWCEHPDHDEEDDDDDFEPATYRKHAGQFPLNERDQDIFDWARHHWEADSSQEITDAASHLTGAEGWSKPSYRIRPGDTESAQALMDHARHIDMPLYHGTPHLREHQVGDTFSIPLMAATKKRKTAEEFSRAGRWTPEGEPPEDDHRVYEFPHGAYGVEIHANEHVITGKYRVAEVHPKRVVLHPVSPKTATHSVASLFRHFATKDDDISDIQGLLGGPQKPWRPPQWTERDEAERQERVQKHQEWQAGRPGINPGGDISQHQMGKEYPHAEWVPIHVAQHFREHTGDQNYLSGKIVDDIAGQLKAGRGMTDPLMLLHHNEAHRASLGEGNHRLAAAERAGWSHVPMRVVRMYDGEAERGKGRSIPHVWRGGHQGRTPEMGKPSDVFFMDALDHKPLTKDAYRREGGSDGSHEDLVVGHSRAGPGLDRPHGVRRDAGAGQGLPALPAARRVAVGPGDNHPDLDWHPRCAKDWKALAPHDRKRLGKMIDQIVTQAANLKAHPLSGRLSGYWAAESPPASHRVVYRPLGEGRYLIGHVTAKHDYNTPINRLGAAESCDGAHHLPRSMSRLEDGTLEGMCISCMEFHPVYEVIPPSKPEWKKEFRLAPHSPSTINRLSQQHILGTS